MLPGSQPAPDGTAVANLLLLALPLVLLAVLLWSSARRRRAVARLQQTLAVGDEVVLTSGIIGRIRELADDVAAVEVAPGTVLTVDRRAVGGRRSEILGTPAPTGETR